MFAICFYDQYFKDLESFLNEYVVKQIHLNSNEVQFITIENELPRLQRPLHTRVTLVKLLTSKE